MNFFMAANIYFFYSSWKSVGDKKEAIFSKTSVFDAQSESTKRSCIGLFVVSNGYKLFRQDRKPTKQKKGRIIKAEEVI